MPFLYLLEYLAVVFVITFVITQLVIPLIAGRPILPMLRRGARLEAEFRRAQADRDNAVMEGEVQAERAEAAKLRGHASRQSNG